ncbi:DUF998 domain-containing protein [Crystallibacter degradans]|uniref:DUF998 domain-containing protein n=1 Tax=Crystallibacter degradans TaxID=2726743 RepID=UPI001474D816|nr:DUF998 domain-containing protein [Arthrobacter sp. SF27]NMR30449.1 DUF998 domain-containing protein [Arthrobacter sp. SF27]
METTQPLTAGRRRYAAAAMAGAVIYAVVDVVLHLLPPHYNPISDAESNLAVGPFGWIMNLNFLGRAVMTFCVIAAISRTGPATGLRRTGSWLLGIGGVCSGVLAFFSADVLAAGASGLRVSTTEGTIHLYVAAFGFLAALAAFVLLTLWIRTSTNLRNAYPAALAFTLLAGAGLASLGLAIGFAPELLGLAERICLVGILGWAFAVAAAIRRSDP